MSVDQVINAHRARGRTFSVGDVDSFVLDHGTGPPVVLMHGVPSSSFLYRKTIDGLARRGMRGVAFDLPGMGLASRPEGFDYSWTGLGHFSIAAVDVLDLPRFHLVVHDIGGPIGLELAAAMPDRVASLTILNSPVCVASFSRPWVMEPFAHRGLGDLWLRSMRPPFFVPLMYMIGLEDRSAMSRDEINAYPALMKLGDGGRAFLKIMRGFELTAEKEDFYLSTLRAAPYPVQIVWGREDPALGVHTRGEQVRHVLPDAPFHKLPAKHFLPEDQSETIADLIVELARVPDRVL